MLFDDSSYDDEDEYPVEADWEDEAESETVLCPECGAAVYEDAAKCPRCGAWIIHESPAAARSRTWLWPLVIALVVLGLILIQLF
jgi:uncharacterized paraquat-inducible protein A